MPGGRYQGFIQKAGNTKGVTGNDLLVQKLSWEVVKLTRRRGGSFRAKRGHRVGRRGTGDRVRAV